MKIFEYEKAQIEIIKLDYESKGYVVELEGHIPTNDPNRKFRADLIARRVDPREFIVVEIVNGRNKRQGLQARIDLIQKLAAADTEIFFDFRYIDIQDEVTERAAFGASLAERDMRSELNALLDRRIRKQNSESKAFNSSEFLSCWGIFSQTIRAFASGQDLQGLQAQNGISIEELWGHLREHKGFGEMASNEPDLLEFEGLVDRAAIAVQGGGLATEDVELLHAALRSLRRVIHRFQADIGSQMQ